MRAGSLYICTICKCICATILVSTVHVYCDKVIIHLDLIPDIGHLSVELYNNCTNRQYIYRVKWGNLEQGL